MLQRAYRPLIPLLLASLLGCAEESAPLDQQLYVWQRQWRPAHAATWGVQTGETLPYGRFYAGGTPEAVGSHWMRTPPLQAGAGNLVVSFKHRYRFEQDGATSYDGGQLMHT